MKQVTFILIASLCLTACQNTPDDRKAVADCETIEDEEAAAACREEAYDLVRDLRQNIRKTRRIKRN